MNQTHVTHDEVKGQQGSQFSSTKFWKILKSIEYFLTLNHLNRKVVFFFTGQQRSLGLSNMLKELSR